MGGGPITDNSAKTGQGSTNWPLRAGKHTMWDGGVRGVSFVYFPHAIPSGRWGGLQHMIDILPTMLSALNVTATPKPGFELDGLSMWDAWRTQGKSPRAELLLNIDTYRDGWDQWIPS